MERDLNIVPVNLRKMALSSLLLIVLSLIFGVCETFYFGNNWIPNSYAELFCDFLASAICGMGMSLFMAAIILKVKSTITYGNS